MKFSLTTDLTEGEFVEKLIEIAGAGFDSVELNISDLELSLKQNQNIKKYPARPKSSNNGLGLFSVFRMIILVLGFIILEVTSTPG